MQLSKVELRYVLYLFIRIVVYDKDTYLQHDKCYWCDWDPWSSHSSISADITRYPILRTYRNIKLSFGTEPYIYLVQDKRYRHAISRLRCSSHILHIEKGRYTRPRTPLHERLCYLCNCVEDELHFVTACSLNLTERTVLYEKVAGKFPEFDTLDDMGNFCSYSHSKMLKRSLGLGNFCINHLQSKHPNEMVTSCSWWPQGHGRRWGLSCWQPPTPPLLQWLPHTLRYFPELIIGVWYR